MKVLLVGGAGLVGTFITPYLQQTPFDFGSSTSAHRATTTSSTSRARSPTPRQLRRALDGVDTFINMVMKSPQGGSSTEQTLTQIAENYEVNTLGLHLLLWTAQAWASNGAYTPAR